MQQAHYETIIEFLLISLIVFTPLAFGSVQLWSWTIIELAAIFLIFIWMLKMLKQGALTFVKTPLNLLIVIFLALVLIQLLPVPSSFLKSISPGTQNFYTGTGIAMTNSRLSLSPYATKTEFFKLIAYAAIFFVVVNNITSRKQINRLIITIILVGSFEAIYGLLEYLSGHQHIFLYQKKWYADCVTGTYINRNHFAGYLEMVVPIAVSFALVTLWGPFRDTGLSWRNKLVAMDKYVAKAGLLMFSALLMMVAVMFSTSRLGIFSLVISLVIMMSLLAIAKKTKTFAWLMCVVIGITILSAAFIGLSPISKRYSFLSQELTLAGSRPTVWRDTIRIIKDFPILGTGLGAFASVYPRYKTIKSRVTYDHAHNDCLELLTETGVGGGGIVGIAIVIFGVNLLKTLRSEIRTRARLIKIGILTSVIAIAIHSLGDFNLHIPANALLLSVLIALACSYGTERQVRKLVISGQKTKWILSLALVLCFITTVIVVAKPAIAESFRHRGQKYEEKHDWEQAEKYYQKAIKSDPGNPNHQIALAKAVLFSSGANISKTALHSYMQHLKLAAIHQPHNPYVCYLIGYGYVLSWTDASEEERKFAISNLQYSLRMNSRYSVYAYRAIWNKLKDFALMQEITPKTLAGQQMLLVFIQQNGLRKYRKEQNELVEYLRTVGNK